jgi:signal transduction histidine kinase
LVAYWNAAIRVAFFVLAAWLLSRFKELRDHLHAMVEARTQSLRRLAAELSEAEDAERRRLAHDVHDGFSQMLSMLKLSLAAARGGESDERFDGAIATIDELIRRARTLTFDLHPAMLDHLGLVPTLRRYGEQFARPLGIDVTVTEVGSPHALAPTMTNYLFRAVKELLNNVAKHGQRATEAVVAVHWETAALRIVVDDDGAGFDAAAVAGAVPGPGTGLGLAGIRERVASFGGSLRIESEPGQGTRAVLEVPLVPGSSGGQERTE